MATLGEQTFGNIVYLNESGSPVEFYVACHDYESPLNGAGRTLLVRKDCYDQRAWNSTDVNTYATSTIDAWLNGDYLALLDDNIQVAAGTTTFYYTPGANNNEVTTLSRAIFLLSLKELDKTYMYANAEGSALPVSSALQIAYGNEVSSWDGSVSYKAVIQWTRSPGVTSISQTVAHYVSNTGSSGTTACTGSYYSRPCLTLPASMTVDGGATS